MGDELTFGAWLRGRRKAPGLTQNGLAERVGCSVEMVHNSERAVAAVPASGGGPGRPPGGVPADHPALAQWAQGTAPPPPAYPPCVPAAPPAAELLPPL